MFALLVLVGLAGACGKKVESASPATASAAGEPTASVDLDTDGAAAKAPATDDEFEFDEVPETEAGGPTPPAFKEAQARIETALQNRRHQLEVDTLALAHAKAELQTTKAAFEAQMNEIQALEKRLDERLGLGEKARQRRAERIGALAKLLLNMQPQSAADMIAKMSNDDAQDLLLTMAQESERKASKLLSAMSGERAAELGQLYIDSDPKAALLQASVLPEAISTPPLPMPEPPASEVLP